MPLPIKHLLPKTIRRLTSQRTQSMKTSPFLLSLDALTGALSLHASEAPLAIGDPAPKLQVGKWMLGEPVKEFARDKAYLVDFWATWCGP